MVCFSFEFWLKPFLFKAILLVRVDLFVLLFVVWLFAPRQLMGRNRRWVLEDSIQDAVWKTILRGPRPPSVRWEKQRSESAVANTANPRKDSKKETKSKDTAKVPKVVQVQPRSNRQSPLDVAAQAKVQRLQAALSVLGDADAVEKENPERALSRAQTQAVVPPVSAQINSTKGFIDREKKRLAAAEEAVLAAVQNRDECIKALAEGERRLEELQLQEKSFVAPVPDAEAELIRLFRDW